MEYTSVRMFLGNLRCRASFVGWLQSTAAAMGRAMGPASTLLLAQAVTCMEQGRRFELKQATVNGAIRLVSGMPGSVTLGSWIKSDAGRELMELARTSYHECLPQEERAGFADVLNCDAMRQYVASAWMTACTNHVVSNFGPRHWAYVQSIFTARMNASYAAADTAGCGWPDDVPTHGPDITTAMRIVQGASLQSRKAEPLFVSGAITAQMELRNVAPDSSLRRPEIVEFLKGTTSAVRAQICAMDLDYAGECSQQALGRWLNECECCYMQALRLACCASAPTVSPQRAPRPLPIRVPYACQSGGSGGTFLSSCPLCTRYRNDRNGSRGSGNWHVRPQWQLVNGNNRQVRHCFPGSFVVIGISR
jgi:hypothetical protein